MKKISKREKLTYIALVSLLIAILLLSVVTDIYAKYSSTYTGSGSIELAKWNVEVNGKNEAENFDLNIEVQNGEENKIYPGSSGTFQIVINNKSDVAAEYTISLEEFLLNTNIRTDSLQIYLDNSYSKNINIQREDVVGKIEKNSEKTIVFYWKWVENIDQDQVIAENYNGFMISAKVVSEQTQIELDEDIDYKIKNK